MFKELSDLVESRGRFLQQVDAAEPLPARTGDAPCP
jgi:hypothetical protein